MLSMHGRETLVARLAQPRHITSGLAREYNPGYSTVAASIHVDSIMKLMPPSRFLGIRTFKQITSIFLRRLLTSLFLAKFSNMATAEGDRKRAMIAIQSVFDK